MDTPESLKNSKDAQYASVLENALDAVVAMDSRGVITLWNTQAEKTFGWKLEEVRGLLMSEVIIPPQYREAHEKGLRHYLATGAGPVLNRRIEISAVDRRGREFPVELSITPIQVAGAEIQFYSFLRDISDRKLADDQKQELLLNLKTALQARDEFIGIASHELKTPLTSLRLQFQIAEKQLKSGDARVFSPDAVQKRIKITNRQIDRMIHLIDGMLDISRITTGKLHFDLSEVDLSAVVTELVERFSEQWALVGCEVSTKVEPGIFVKCDVYRMEQVISNLITNSIKYAAGTRIHVSLARKGANAMFSLRDEGQGIDPADQERVFNRFERAIPASSISGLGLGLYITRQIIESQGGRIWVESEKGKGSEFFFELPLL